jgi:hypothetical protein
MWQWNMNLYVSCNSFYAFVGCCLVGLFVCCLPGLFVCCIAGLLSY